MPILAGALVAPVPPPVAPVVVVEPRDYARARWIDPLGNEWPLDMAELGWFTLDVVSGLGAAPIAMTTDDAPRGGSSVRHIQPVSRLITWPLHIYGQNHTEFLTRWRQLVRAFTMTRRRGPGRLVISRSDGTEREILAYYQEGFNGEPGHGYVEDDVVLTLFCPDAYWRDADAIVQTRAYGVAGSYLSPYLTLASSQVLGETTLTNPGDTEAYPDWTITGPASLITVTNDSTGESWTLDPNATGIAHGPLLVGETVTVSTDPPAIRGPGGAVWTAALNWPGAVLWPLDEGQVDVTFAVTGAAAGTSVSLAFRPRYETA